MNDPLDDLLRTASEDLRAETNLLPPPDFEPRGQGGKIAVLSAAVLLLVGGALALNGRQGEVQIVEGATTVGAADGSAVTVTPTTALEPTTIPPGSDPESESTVADPGQDSADGQPFGPSLPAPVDVGSLRTDREAVGLAQLQAVDPGEVFTDPVFGTEVLRLTDAAPGSTIAPGLVGTQVFNADGSLFVLHDSSTDELIVYRTDDLTEVRRLTLSGGDQINFFWHPSASDRLIHVGLGGLDIVERSVTDDQETVVASPGCDYLRFRTPFGTDAGTDFAGFLCDRNDETYRGYLDMTSGQLVIAEEPITGQLRAPIAVGSDGTTFVAIEDSQVIVLDASLNPTPVSPLPISAKAVAFTVDPVSGRTALMVTDYDSTNAAMAASFDLSTGERTNVVAQSEGDAYPPNGLRMSSASGQDLIAAAGRGDRDQALDGEVMLVDPSGTVYRVARHGMVDGDFGDLDDALVKLSPDQSILLFSSNLGGAAIDTFVIRLG